jgi:hypothetical protein
LRIFLHGSSVIGETDIPNDLARTHLQTEDMCGTNAGSEMQVGKTKKARATEE